MDEVNYFFIVYLSLFYFYSFLFIYLFSYEIKSLCFLFLLCLNLSDGNHSALHLLHLRQHSLDAGQDFVLVCCRGDTYASHVPEKKKGKRGILRPKTTEKKNPHEGLIHTMNFTAFQWNLA